MTRYRFVPLREEDLDLVQRWLMTPHVREWWDDQPGAVYPDAELQEYRDDLVSIGATHRYIVHLDDRPIGLIQSYRVDEYDDYYAAFGLEEPAMAVDLFIGEADLLERGHGSAFLREYLLTIGFALESREVCVIDPAERNLRAIRAYQRAGFRRLRSVVVPGEREPQLILRTTRAELERAAS